MSIDPPPPRSRHRLFWLLVMISLVLAIAGARKGYDNWRSSQMAEYKDRCRKADQEMNWKELMGIAREWADWDPDEPDAWLFLAEGQLQSGEPQNAVKSIDQISRKNPKAVPAMMKKAQIEFELLNQPLRSEQTSLELLELEPRLVEVRGRLIFFYALTLQRVRLIEQIEESIRLGSEPPDAYVYLLMCDHLYFTNGAQLNKKWLLSAPDSEMFQVAETIQFDEILQKLENQTEATRQTRNENQLKLDRYLERYPHNSALLRYYLHRYAEESKVQDVARILSMVPPDAGDDSIFWRFRGWYQAAVNDLENAEESYRKSLDLTGTDWRAWQGLAEVLRLKGNLTEAERCQKIALTGKTLRQELLRLPTAKDITDDLLEQISEYADACGETELAAHLKDRVKQRRQGR